MRLTILAASLLAASISLHTARAGEAKHTAFLEDESSPASDGTKSLADAQAKLDAAWDRLPLTVRKAVFVSQKTGMYGSYNERGNSTFKSGESLLTYIEPVGYRYEEADDGFVRFGVSLDFEILQPDGTVATGKKGFLTFSTSSRAKLKELMLNASLDLDGAPAGDYVLRYTIHDLHSTKTAEASLPFTIAR